MDSIYIGRMRENRKWFLKMSVWFGILFTFCLYRNLSGITFPVITAVAVWFSVLFLKKVQIRIRKGTGCYYAGILLLGVSVVLTDNVFFHFFNYVGMILLFMMSMIRQLYMDREWGFQEYVKKFFIMTGAWITSAAEPFRKKEDNHVDKSPANVDNSLKSVQRKQIKAVLSGVAAAVVLLVLVLPLLMSSDRVFSMVFDSIFSCISPWNIFHRLDIANIIGAAVTFLFGTVALYAFFAGLFKMNPGEKTEERTRQISSLTGISFASVMALIYVIYSGIQILVLFLRIGNGLPEGVTYSQYAREGFWQLLLVSMINFIVVILCVRIIQENRIFRYLLTLISVCTCIMILSAAYRMMLYVGEYNLTFLRVLVLWFLGVLMIIFFGVIYSIYRRNFRLFRYVAAVVSVCYILFSLSHADAWIAGYNIASDKELSVDDVWYLTTLSLDAAPEIGKLYDRLNGEDPGEEREVKLTCLDGYFSQIEEDAQKAGIRSWNYSRSAAKTAAAEWNSTSRE